MTKSYFFKMGQVGLLNKKDEIIARELNHNKDTLLNTKKKILKEELSTLDNLSSMVTQDRFKSFINIDNISPRVSELLGTKEILLARKYRNKLVFYKPIFGDCLIYNVTKNLENPTELNVKDEVSKDIYRHILRFLLDKNQELPRVETFNDDGLKMINKALYDNISRHKRATANYFIDLSYDKLGAEVEIQNELKRYKNFRDFYLMIKKYQPDYFDEIIESHHLEPVPQILSFDNNLKIIEEDSGQLRFDNKRQMSL